MLWPILVLSAVCGFAGSNERIASSRVHVLLLATLAGLVIHELARSRTA